MYMIATPPLQLLHTEHEHHLLQQAARQFRNHGPAVSIHKRLDFFFFLFCVAGNEERRNEAGTDLLTILLLEVVSHTCSR